MSATTDTILRAIAPWLPPLIDKAVGGVDIIEEHKSGKSRFMLSDVLKKRRPPRRNRHRVDEYNPVDVALIQQVGAEDRCPPRSHGPPRRAAQAPSDPKDDPELDSECPVIHRPVICPIDRNR